MNLILLKQIKELVLDIIFPKFCAGCAKEGLYLCLDCKKKITRLEKQRCLVCQKPSPFGKTHVDCAKTKVDGVISALTYHDPITKALVAIYKYKFVDLSELLAELMWVEIQNQELQNFFQEFLLVPVPLHKKRLAWRGFNQSKLLAEKLSLFLNIPMNGNLVSRTKHTRPQVELTHDQRKINIQNAFQVNAKVKGQKFLIVDDVVTTGSTINEIARVLKKNKAAEVWAITLAAD